MEDFFGTNIDLSELTEKAISLVMTYTPKLLLAILTLVVGLWLVNRFVNLLDHRLGKKDPTLNKFLCGLISAVLKVMLLISVASMIGIETTSFIAVVGAAGLAIGLALQGTLSNVAAGVMLLVLRPFKISDYIDAGGLSGTVMDMGLFTSELKTADGVYIMVPNSSLWNTNIINYSRNLTRRIEVEIGISYEDDLIGAMNVLMNVMRADSRVLNDPAPQTIITELADSSVNIKMRCWSSADDSWLAPFDLRRNAKLEIEKAGYTIPFPQREVRIIDSFPISTQEK